MAGTPRDCSCPRPWRASPRISDPHGRILVGIPERHLLTAGSLGPNDPEFAALFADFVLEQSGAADEPIDRRLFELVDGRLVVFAGVTPGL